MSGAAPVDPPPAGAAHGEWVQCTTCGSSSLNPTYCTDPWHADERARDERARASPITPPAGPAIQFLSPSDEAYAARLRERRERIATAVLQGTASCARTRWDNVGPVLDPCYATRAVEWADALIAELDRR